MPHFRLVKHKSGVGHGRSRCPKKNRKEKSEGLDLPCLSQCVQPSDSIGLADSQGVFFFSELATERVFQWKQSWNR